MTLALCSNRPAYAADPLAKYDDHTTTGLTRVDGLTYANADYGYAVRIPNGQMAWRSTAPAPNHGFSIYLGDKRSIEVDASFDSALLGSTSAVAEDVANDVNGAQNAKMPETLGNRSAERIVQSWPNSDRRRVIVARWNDSSGPGDAIVFTLTLETTLATYEQDRKTFNTTVRSFRFTPRSQP